jgi:hypothetical protein
MGRGGSGTRRRGLPKYAKAFSARAMTAPALDYRNFGASDGEARQAVIVAEQHDAAGRRYGLCARWRADPRRGVQRGCGEVFKSHWGDDDHELGHDAGLPALITSPPDVGRPLLNWYSKA